MMMIADAPASTREKDTDGKSIANPQHGKLSSAYETFIEPLADKTRGAFDVHIYYMQVCDDAFKDMSLEVVADTNRSPDR